MTVGFHKLNQMVMSIAVALSNVVLLLEQINIFPGIWYGTIDLANAFCSIPVNKDRQKQFAFSCLSQQYIITTLPRAILILQSYVIICSAGVLIACPFFSKVSW